MKLYNITKNTLLPYEVIVCNNFFARLKGMMFLKEEEAASQAYLIHPCRQIHTFFMRFPIDVVFMNKNESGFEVKEIIKNIKPYSFSPYAGNSNCVLEFISRDLNVDYFNINDKIK